MNNSFVRVAIVTGSSSGNGRAIALRLAEFRQGVVCAFLAAPEAEWVTRPNDPFPPSKKVLTCRSSS